MFLRAVECVPDLETAVAAAAEELGEPRRLGAAVVVDGVDEIGHQAADSLLMQARTLVRTWPETTVLMTSRTVPALSDAQEHMPVPPLTDDEQEECLDIGAGPDSRRPSIFTFPDPVRATLGQPMFALLAGLWMRERSTAPRAPIDLMRMLGERARRGIAVDEFQLRQLAVMSVARELGEVPSAEIVGGSSIDELMATGMLVRHGDAVAYVLPAAAQWFAAQALLLGEVPVESPLDAPEDLELWRYPLALAVSLGSSEQAQAALGPLLGALPGFAMRVLEAAFGQAILEGGTPPPWREGARQVRATLQALADGLGPLAPLVLDTDADGEVLPFAAGSNEHHLTIAFRLDPTDRPEISELPADFHPFDLSPEFRSSRGAKVGPGATWAWNWSMGGARHAFDRLLRFRRLPIPVEGPLAHEAAWAAACDLLDENVLVCDSIDLDQIAEPLHQIGDEMFDEGPVILRRTSASHDLRGLRHVVNAARARGETTLAPPVPAADVLAGGGWIGDFFSDAHLHLIATVIYESALVGYRQLVERWMPTLLDDLEHYVLLPMRIVGFVNNGRGGGPGLGGIPSLAGYIEALAPGSADEVHMTVGPQGYDFDLGDHSYAQQRATRPWRDPVGSVRCL